MMGTTFRGCPHCPLDEFYLDQLSLRRLLLGGGTSPIIDDLARPSGEAVLNKISDGTERDPDRFPACDHTVLFQLSATFDRSRSQVSSAFEEPSYERYRAGWFHPHFRSIRNKRLATEMKIRLADGIPHPGSIAVCGGFEVRRMQGRLCPTHGQFDPHVPAILVSITWIFDWNPDRFLTQYQVLVESLQKRPLLTRPVFVDATSM